MKAFGILTHIMKGSEIITLVFTFVTGLCAGMFLYVTVFAPTVEEQAQVWQGSSSGDWTITGEMYGGCMRTDTCGSFRLTNGSSFEYLPVAESEVQKGRLPHDVRKMLQETLTEDFLIEASQEVHATSCSSFVDGIDYRYTVMLDGISYVLDTCSSVFALEEGAQTVMLDIWYFMENPEVVPPVLLEKNIFDLLIWDRFNAAQ